MSSSGASATSGSRLFMSMRRAASCCQPLQLIAVPRGARTALAPVRAPLPCVCPLVGIDPPSLHLAAPSNTRLGHGTRQAVSYTHLRAHETRHDLVCRLLL